MSSVSSVTSSNTDPSLTDLNNPNTNPDLLLQIMQQVALLEQVQQDPSSSQQSNSVGVGS